MEGTGGLVGRTEGTGLWWLTPTERTRQGEGCLIVFRSADTPSPSSNDGPCLPRELGTTETPIGWWVSVWWVGVWYLRERNSGVLGLPAPIRVTIKEWALDAYETKQHLSLFNIYINQEQIEKAHCVPIWLLAFLSQQIAVLAVS